MKKNDSKKVSVIVPVYNVEKYLGQCIESIEKQTYNCIEIIIIDDGSTDKSLAIARQYEKKFNNIIVISQKNGGQGSARNTGLKNATGDYISFVDSDDLIDSNMYKDMLNLLLEYDLDMVECSYQEFSNKEKGYIYKSGTNDNVLYSGPEYYENNPLLSPCNKLYKFDFLKEVGFSCTENRFAEDVYDITYLFLKCKKIMRLDKCFYFYRRDNEYSTRNNVDIDHKIKLGRDKLYISNKLDNLRLELNCNGYISNIIIRNIFGVIFSKNYIFNNYYRKNVKPYIKEYNIQRIINNNISFITIISLMKAFVKRIVLKKD